MWRVFLKRGEFRGATIGVFEAEGGYPRLFEESHSPELPAEQTGDNRRHYGTGINPLLSQRRNKYGKTFEPS